VVIVYQGKYYDYPLKAFNALFNLGIIETILMHCQLAPKRASHPRDTLEETRRMVTNQFAYGTPFQISSSKPIPKSLGCMSTKALPPTGCPT